MKLTVADIARILNGEYIGDGSLLIEGFNGLKDAANNELSFLANPKYLNQAQESQAGAILVAKGQVLDAKTLIVVDNPSLAFTRVIEYFQQDQKALYPQGVHSSAVIGSEVTIGQNVHIGPFCVIEHGAIIADGVKICAHSYIGHGVRVGESSMIYPHVTVRESVMIGKRVIIHSGTVVGCDGYGYLTIEGEHQKIPQVGIVVIEDDVEIGANVTIDRARFDKTIIGRGTKIDNLVHIAHNVRIGKNCLIVAQVGISGSSQIGDNVILAGQVGVVGHITIGDGAIVTAQSGVSKSVKAGEQMFGSPAQPIREAFRINAHVQRLEQYASTIKLLKERIEALEKK
jgi:UDP-3-O-[3-hydroxymyristoyl] glucosamine N-acyltransferase